ncbi:MAG TPA: ECF-type sigma factor [Woeseiaceae bacterium]|nr:ECF-type sigma factor [Woeseiaceae bacterium]
MGGVGDITRLLQEASAGSRRASDALFESVYLELRKIAKAQRRRWSGNETLNTTALINEAYVRLAAQDLANYQDRAHFFATASKAMRQVLINYAERYTAAKRGGNALRVTLSGLSLQDASTVDELLLIDSLLNKLEANNPRRCRVFECRVFGGMTVEETATALDVSAATVKRDWTVVSAWLFSEMKPLGDDTIEDSSG